MVNKRINALREVMKERGIAVYLIPTSDFHESEYVGEYFKTRKFITGFTGSAGTAVITLEESGLWTDGRYFIQAAAQLRNSEVTLFRMGEEGVPTVTKYIEEHLPKGGCLGFDGRVVNTALGKKLAKIAEKKQGIIYAKEDLIDRIWKERPALPAEPAFLLDVKYAGETAPSKMKRVRQCMEQNGADVHIMTTLDDIAWMLNLRGNDISHFPVVLSFFILTRDAAKLFVNRNVLNKEIVKALTEDGICVYDYDEIYKQVATLNPDKTVLMDCSKVNYAIFNALNSEIRIVDKQNPTILMKAVKNPVELENIRKAHVQDGVAFTKFMYWLKKNIGKIPMTELTASNYLEQCRKAQEGFLDLSFDTISAYGANAAMMHYAATEESQAELKQEGFLLVDSGGHYYCGSTDITRTIALGCLSRRQKELFTVVLRSNLNLAAAKFLEGCSGYSLDILSRGPLWELGLDYKCGTGHGVGYLLNIHEPPNGFRWKMVAERLDSAVLREGMVTTDEPGVYLEGEYGIRTENELICRKAEKNEYGQFMEFETITLAPIDLDAVLPEEMTKRERTLLNDYHHSVYEKISPYLTVEEASWLKEYTREI